MERSPRCAIGIVAIGAAGLGAVAVRAGGQAEPGPPPNPWASAARDVLAQHCGSCHRHDLSTAKPRALAVFDLLENPWYVRLTSERLGEVLRRVKGTSAILPEDAAIVERFVLCARDGACDETGASGAAGSSGGSSAGRF